jgi:prepilin-type N-terminal cleavage/methylation domain-containing protein
MRHAPDQPYLTIDQKRNEMKKAQSGFTLVEIAIVLVIIGLLLGGVLKGQEMIENAKVKNAINDFNGITAASYGYTDRFRRIAGDDGPIGTLTARGGMWATLPADGAGNNNGVLGPLAAAATFTGAGTNDEGDAFWMQLKAAGFITGNSTDANVAALPRNGFNGLTGITTDGTIMNNMPGTKLCMSEVPGKAARAIDTQLDDGVGNTGAVRNTVAVAGASTPPGAAVAAYNDNNIYTICRNL